MHFDVKRNADYRELVVTDGGATLESGLFDVEQRKAMAQALRDAADDLVYGLEETN